MTSFEDDLRRRRDFDFGAKMRLSCGEHYRHMLEDFEFVVRLTDVSNPNAAKSLDFSKESFDLFIHYESKIYKLIDDGLKAIIFQEVEVQLFVWQYDEAVGYQAHFQDKRRTTISMNKTIIAQLARLKKDVEEEYTKYKLRKLKRRKKQGKLNREEKPERKKPNPKKPNPKKPNPKKPNPKKPYQKKPSPKYRVNK